MKLMTRLAGGAAMSALALALSVAAAHAQETTGAVRGQVTDQTGAPVAGATVTVLHVPTGTRSTTVTGSDGFYTTRGLRVGGPYRITVAASGAQGTSITLASVGVGDPEDANLSVTTNAGNELAGVEVIASPLRSTQGPSTSLNRSSIEGFPSVSRDLKDIARVNPFATIDQTNQDALSFVGVNNRFNQLTVDGIRQNDDFGLNNNGYPTQRSPVSIDAVQAIQVAIAPYSVINNGFLGGAINVVTRSGTNEFHGSVYGEYSDQDMRGNRVLGFDTTSSSGTFGTRQYRPVAAVFKEQNYGATLGGPIIQDRLFFFLSYDHYEGNFFVDEGPADSGRTSLIPRITTASVATFQAGSQATYGYDPGTIVSATPPITDVKYLARLDWNITDDHRLTLTFQDTHGQSFNGSTSDLFISGDSVTQPRLSLLSQQYVKDEQLRTYTAQLNSHWTSNFSTELRLGDKHTVQNRITLGSDPTVGQVTVGVADLPGVLAGTGTPQIQFGTEINSQPNFLDITVDTAEAIARYHMNDHELMAGVRAEHQDILNIFGRNYLPTYTFTSYANFLNHQAATVALVGAVNPTGGTVPATSGTAAAGAAAFSYTLGSIYAEDTWRLTDSISLLYGLRYDRFFMDDVPVNNPSFATRNGFSNQQNLDGKGIVLPRIYATWRPNDRFDASVGFGRFSNQGLNVWISNPFANDGQRVTNAVCPAGPYTLATLSAVPAGCTFTPGNGNTNVLDPNLRIANVWKSTISLGYNANLGWAGDDWRFQIDLIHQDNRDSLLWVDLRSVQVGVAPDGRPVYGRTTTGTIGANVFDMELTNVDNGGQSNSAAISMSHSWRDGLLEGLDMLASYTWTHATDRNPMTSSIADSSYVRFASTNHQNPSAATSDYEIRNKIAVNFSYTRRFFGDNATNFSVFIQNRSGLPFSYTFDASRTGNFDNDFGNVVTQTFSGRQANSNQLLYVPAVDASGNVTLTSDPRVTYAAGFTPTVLAQFNDLLRNTGLIQYAGRVAPRNGFAGGNITTIDLHISQELPAFVPRGAHLQAYLDIENFGNLLNNRWGLLEQYDFYRGVPVVGMQCVGGAVINGQPSCSGASSFQFQTLRQSSPGRPLRPFPFVNSSLWQLKVGLRYRF